MSSSGRISQLTPDSAVYFLMMVEDATGARFGTTDVLDQIAPVSSVPIYTWWDGYLGHGVVGGKLRSPKGRRTQAAELALRILRGQGTGIPIVSSDASRVAFDWRELQRWNLGQNRLPANAEILFRETTFWERYRNWIIGAIALLILQFTLIVALLFQGWKRRQANLRLKTSEERYRNVVEAQSELICRFSPGYHADVCE
jgi:PAS domain-containing protein